MGTQKLTTSDPSSLANLARCWSSCIPIGMQSAVRTYILNQYVFQKTCVKPTSPDNGGSTVTSSTVTVTWTEGASPLAPVDGFRIIWGTTNHSNNLGDVTVPAAPLSYTITGLAPSQTIFFDIFALSGGCQSALSTGGNATTSAAICAFAAAWAARVVANGGANPSAATQQAICDFQNGLVTDGLDVKMISWTALVPDSLIAAITPQLAGGGNDPWTNNGFVGGDLTVNGLLGDGATKYLDTNLVPNTIYTSDADCGITIYAFTNPNAANCEVGSNDGAFDNAVQLFGGSTFFDCWNPTAGQGRISAANAGFTGYVSCNRTAANAFAIYEANSGVAHNTLVSGVTAGGVRNAVGHFVFALHNVLVPTTWSSKRLSFVAFHHAMTSAQSALFFARIQTLRTALGGGFV